MPETTLRLTILAAVQCNLILRLYDSERASFNPRCLAQHQYSLSLRVLLPQHFSEAQTVLLFGGRVKNFRGGKKEKRQI